MAYLHDVFISYRRDPQVVLWIREHFVPLLQLRLGYELGNAPDIYTDERIEAASTWPVELANELASSRILISLWSKNYLNSRWCSLELAHMVARERSYNCRTPANPSGIVVFAVVHDGETIPHDLQIVQRIEIQKSFNVRMRRDSPRAEELDAIITDSAPGIASAIQNAPEFKPSWSEEAARAFFDQFHQGTLPSQLSVPRFT
jgi:hypothetical protein